MAGLKIGIFGGSFNPIHNGHLALGKTVCDELALDQLIFIPAGFPPHKSHQFLAPAEHRYAMVKLAVTCDRRFSVSRLELDSEETTYTVTTLKAFRQLFTDEDQLFFIMGADSLVDLVNWWSFGELVTLCTFVAAARPGISRETMTQQIEVLKSQFGAKVMVVDMPLMDLSASEIRHRIARGEGISPLVPEPVASYIVQNGLYGGVGYDPEAT